MAQTIKELLAYVDELKPNVFSELVKTRWLNMLEGMIQTEILLISPKGCVQYRWPEDEDTELLIGAPHDRIYEAFLFWKIDEAVGESERANNSLELYNTAWEDLMLWVARHIRPGKTDAQKELYYISAYQIAVKRGYAGTEEEWLESLRGPKGDPLRIEDMTQEEIAALKGDPFTYEDFTPAQLESLRGPAGESIEKIERTAGSGAAGTTDTYTVTMTSGRSGGMFYVYNGADGAGAGDMTKAAYDANGAILAAGGIEGYVSDIVGAINAQLDELNGEVI